MGQGDGETMVKYLAKCAGSADIVAYREKINWSIGENQQENVTLGSQGAFSDLQAIMRKNTDVLLLSIDSMSLGSRLSAPPCRFKKC
jgi:hypothetical protein